MLCPACSGPPWGPLIGFWGPFWVFWFLLVVLLLASCLALGFGGALSCMFWAALRPLICCSGRFWGFRFLLVVFLLC